MKPGTLCLSPKGELVEVVAVNDYGMAVTWRFEDGDRYKLLGVLDYSTYAFENLLEIPPELSVLIK